MSDLEKIYKLISFLEEFKKLERFVGQTYWKNYPQPKKYESVADHTWRMAMILIFIEDYLEQPIDFSKAMKMLLIHDIPEIIAGDLSPLGASGTGSDSHAFNKKIADEKFANEKRAAKEIFSKLPQEQGIELMDLWLEYETQASFEARLVKAIDKFEGKLQVLEYTKGRMFKKHFDFTIKYGADSFDVDATMQELGDLLLSEFHKNFTEFSPQGNTN